MAATETGNQRTPLRVLKLLWLASLVGPVLLFAAGAWHDRSTLYDEAERDAGHMADALREHALKVVETNDLVARQFAQRVAGLSWDSIRTASDLDRELKQLAAPFPQVNSIALSDAQGTQWLSSLPAPQGSISVADRDFWLAQRDEDAGTYISQAFRGRFTNRGNFAISRRLPSANGQFTGIVHVAVSVDYFADFWRKMVPAAGRVVALTRADGALLIQYPMAEPITRSARDGLMQAVARATDGFFTGRSDIDGVERLTAYRNLGGYPLFISYAVDPAVIERTWLSRAAMLGGLCAVMALALASLTGYAIQRTRREALALERLHDSEARHRAYFEAQSDALYVLRVTEDGRFLSEARNRTAVELSGIPLEHSTDRPIDVFLPPDTAATVLMRLRECVQTGLPVHWEHTVAFPAGARTFEEVLVPVSDPSGRVHRLVGSARDVTARRALEQVAQRAQKMEAIGQLTGGVAHDFNNLLQAVANCLALLQQKPQDQASLHLIDVARQAVERGAKLTKQLVAFARRQNLAPAPTDLNALVRSSRDMLERSIGGTVQIQVQTTEDAWPALVDPNQIDLALLNLAINARDAMPQGGRLLIRIRNTQVGTAPTTGIPAGLAAGEYVVVSVSDTGTGMPADVLERAFEPFFTTKEVGRGSGLGLSMVHGMVSQLGGAVHIDSRPGHGTTVELYVPRARQTASDVTTLVAAPPRPGHGTVLLVEDDDLVRAGSVAVLRQLGYVVLEAQSGSQALDLLRRDTPIDLLITDYAMPGMTGLELIGTLRTLRPGLAALIVTGHAELPDGIDIPVLQKPFSASDLASKVAGILNSAPSSNVVLLRVPSGVAPRLS